MLKSFFSWEHILNVCLQWEFKAILRAHNLLKYIIKGMKRYERNCKIIHWRSNVTWLYIWKSEADKKQNDWDRFSTEWMKKHDFKFNERKHELIYFSRTFKKYNINVNITLKEHQINASTDLKILKIQLNFKLRWESHFY